MKMRKSVKIASFEGDATHMHLVEPAAGRQFGYLIKDEVERLFAAIPSERPRDQLLFDVIYRYGLRRVEATFIRLDHLSDGKIWITRAKGSVSGEYPIHPTTRRLLWAYLSVHPAENPYLFCSRQSERGPMSTGMIYDLFRRYGRGAGIGEDKLHPHVLRHSIAVHLMNAGWDAADVQDWLGHREIASTMVYAAVTNKRRAAKYLEALRSQEIAANGSS
jgi:integrase